MNNGGSAFPMGYESKGDTGSRYGMTLRDYFAAKAMQGMLSDMETRVSLNDSAIENKISFGEEIAIQSYSHADAMLKAREAK